MKPTNQPDAKGVGRIVFRETFGPKDNGREHQRKMNEFVKRLHLTIREARATSGEVRLLVLPKNAENL